MNAAAPALKAIALSIILRVLSEMAKACTRYELWKSAKRLQEKSQTSERNAKTDQDGILGDSYEEFVVNYDFW